MAEKVVLFMKKNPVKMKNIRDGFSLEVLP